MFATPCPQLSRVLLECVSVTSSISFAVISDSISPTSATPSEYGAMIRSVSQVSGTCGMKNSGRLLGSSPRSPTVGTGAFVATAMSVTTRIATSGAGIACVNFGITTMITMASASSGYTAQ